MKTELLARIEATGEPIKELGRRAGLSREALSNAAHGRRRLSPGAAARVEAVLAEALTAREAERRAIQLGQAAERYLITVIGGSL